MAYVWTEAEGPSPTVEARLRQHFPRPSETPPEPWFMSSEQGYITALNKPVEAIDSLELTSALRDLASGTVSFGHLELWDAWFGYLLWAIVDAPARRSRDYEALMTAAIVMVPDLTCGYASLADDVLASLARVPLREAYWRHGDWAWPLRIAPYEPVPDSLLCAASYLVLANLPPEAMRAWVRSLVALGGPRWRAQLVTWLVGAWSLFEQQSPSWVSTPGWENNELVHTDHFPELSRRAFLSAIRKELTPDRLLQWCEQFSARDVTRGNFMLFDDTAAHLFDRLTVESL